MSIAILFVDDDKNLLDGIARLLTIDRDDIDYTMVASAEEALLYLEKKKYDILVSDQKMSGMEGITLLSIAKSKYPEMKRVMLSAQVHENIYREAETIADKYISKPSDFDTIIKEIDTLIHMDKKESI